MAIHTQSNTAQYIGNGVTRVFPGPFPVIEKAHVRVFVATDGDGATELTSGFQVLLEADGTCSVEFTTAPAMGMRFAIARLLPLEQPLDLENGGNFNAEEIEGNFDRLVMQVQQVAEEAHRSFKFAITHTGELPTAGEYAAQITQMRDESVAAAGGAKESEINAKASELAAAASAAAAAVSEVNAKASEVAAKASEVAAAESAVIAVESAQGLQEAAETATTQAGIATEAAQSAKADADRAEADRIAAVAAANHAEERAGVATTEADRATAAADRAESVADVGIAQVGKPGLVAPDGETTFVDPVTGELHVEVGPSVTFDGVTIQQDSTTGDHYVPVASVTQPGAMIPLVMDGGKTPDALLGAWDNAGTLEQVLVPAGDVAVGSAEKLSTARNIQAKAIDGTLGAAVPWDGSTDLVIPLPEVGGGNAELVLLTNSGSRYLAAGAYIAYEWGGGGGGGGGGTTYAIDLKPFTGGGGGGGEVRSVFFVLSTESSVSYTIGAGGIAGKAGTGSGQGGGGGAGGATSITVQGNTNYAYGGGGGGGGAGSTGVEASGGGGAGGGFIAATAGVGVTGGASIEPGGKYNVDGPSVIGRGGKAGIQGGAGGASFTFFHYSYGTGGNGATARATNGSAGKPGAILLVGPF